MKRRNFLSLLGAASLAPALPALPAPAAAAAGYNRYMYGLGVFHARTHAGVSAADLMARLRINAFQAETMLGEMTASGVLSPVTGAATRTITTRARKPYVRKALRHLQEQLTASNEDAEIPAETSQTPDAALRRCTGGARQVHAGCSPVDPMEPTTSSGPKSGVH